ncbi:AI-2E family transporter [Methylobacterium sp. P31]
MQAANQPEAQPVAPRVPPPSTPGPSGLGTTAVLVLVVAVLHFGREIFIPIALAVLLGFLLAPAVRFLRRFIGRILAVLVTISVALGILAALAGVIGIQVAQLATDLPYYQRAIEQKVEGLQEGALGRVSELLNQLNRGARTRTEQPTKPADEPASGSHATPAPAAPKPVPVEVREPPPAPLALTERLIGPLLQPLATTVIILVVLIFILLQRQDLRDRMIRLFGSDDLHRTTAAMDDAARRLSRYFLAQLGVNISFGVLIGCGLWLIGVPSPILWGVVSAIMRFVPYVGAFASAAGPILLAAAAEPGWSMALWTAALFLVTEPLIGNGIEPLLYGHSTGMSPIAVVISALFWTWVWGPVGLLMSTPLTLCLVVLGKHIEHLEFLDVLLGDRPALTPVENFYQRMLAGDADEAAEHAEQLLKERSLSSYYDEVALKGLQMAADDARRGALKSDQIALINETAGELIEDLDDHEDGDPDPEKAEHQASADIPSQSEQALPESRTVADRAPDPQELPPLWRGEAPVLCIAGRGPLDEAAAAMMAQLLKKHGVGARILPHTATRRSRIGELDVQGVALICVSYLDINGTPSRLRYLLRRLRQRAGDIPVLVGLWPSNDAALEDETLRDQIGADYYVATLHAGVEACLTVAREAARQSSPRAERIRELKAQLNIPTKPKK